MRPLSLLEARVLGVLVEKAHTVPDSYPLSLNALTLGCNQKTARDPVIAASEGEVQEATDALRSLSLVFESNGSRGDTLRAQRRPGDGAAVGRRRLAGDADAARPADDVGAAVEQRADASVRGPVVRRGIPGGAGDAWGGEGRAGVRQTGTRRGRARAAVGAFVSGPVELGTPIDSSSEESAVPSSEWLAMKMKMASIEAEIERLRSSLKHLSEELGINL